MTMGIELPTAVDPDELDSGTELVGGKFRLVAQIGRGGGGTVYVAQTEGKRVALKVMASVHVGDAEQEQRFFNEVQITQQLGDHEGVVRPFEVGRVPELGDALYMSMPLVRAPTLASELIKGPLPPRRSCELLCDVADTVSYLHEHGVIHRDIKPSNIILPPDRRPALLDFGYAFSTGEGPIPSTAGLTQVDHRPGTKHYMAPEQVLGYPPGPSFDIYALGVTLFEALIGKPPGYSKSPQEVAFRKVDNDRPSFSIRGRHPEISRTLEEIVDDCLKKDPADRVPSAAALRDRLRDLLNSGSLSDRRLRAYDVDISDNFDRDRDATQIMGSRRPSLFRSPAKTAEPQNAEAVTSAALSQAPIAPNASVASAAATQERAVTPGPLSPAAVPKAATETSFPQPGPVSDGEPLKVVDPDRKWVALSIVGILMIVVAVGWMLLDEPRREGQAREKTETKQVVNGRANAHGRGQDLENVTAPEASPSVVSPRPPPQPVPLPEPKTDGSSTGSPRERTPDAEPVARETKTAPEIRSSKRRKPAAPAKEKKKPLPCGDEPDRAMKASRERKWKLVVTLTEDPRCWSSQNHRLGIRIRALSELGRHEECVRLAEQASSPALRRLGRDCKRSLEENP